MGSGASCTERPSTPLDDRLRTMLILRAYNCRPRDWTMKDQFDAVAENGVLTKDCVRTALRLAECPRIEALLDRCYLFDLIRSSKNNKNGENNRSSSSSSGRSSRSPAIPTSTEGFISVDALIEFVEDGGRQRPKRLPQDHQQEQHFPVPDSSLDTKSCMKFPPPVPPPSPPSSPSTPSTASPLRTPSATASHASASKSPVEPRHSDAHFLALSESPGTGLPLAAPSEPSSTSSPRTSPVAEAAVSAYKSVEAHAPVHGSPVDASGLEVLSPRVVPLTSKWALSSTTSIGEAKHEKRSNQSGAFPSEAAAESRTRRAKDDNERNLKEGGEHLSEEQEGSSNREVEQCKTLVKRLGTVLGLRGKDPYRRPKSGQPVWRKRETLIQERIVQYTTLDEDGAVQELFETEKSQTEVLHMECKRTGEFAHSESTHYESGETFNGEVVLEEAGTERYVHLRSIDDEYEHLESTLPNRARSGGATGGVGGNPPAEGVEGGPGANENTGDADTVVDGEVCDGGGVGNEGSVGEHRFSGKVYDEESEDRHEASNPGRAPRTSTGSSYQERRPECTGGVVNQGGSFTAPSPPPGRQVGAWDDGEDHARTGPVRRDDPASHSFAESPVEREQGCNSSDGKGDRRYRPPSAPPSPYHYRSPSCSPRLSPRPARSPYRQEGVGARESSGRGGDTRCDSQQNGPQGREAENCVNSACRPGVSDGPGDHAVDETEKSGLVRHPDKTVRVCVGAVAQSLQEVDPPLLCPNQQLLTRHAVENPTGAKLIQPLRVDGPEESAEGFAVERVSVDSGGIWNGCEESVVFNDIHLHQGGGGQGDDEAGGENDWWHAESGSVLQGVNFSFEGDDHSVFAEKEMGELLDRAHQPRAAASQSSSAPRPIADGSLSSSSDDHEDNVDISHLIEGLRSDNDPPPAASKPEGQGGCSNSRGGVLEQKGIASTNGDLQSTAPAPYCSQEWGSPEAGQYDGEANLIVAGEAVGVFEKLSGNHVAV